MSDVDRYRRYRERNRERVNAAARERRRRKREAGHIEFNRLRDWRREEAEILIARGHTVDDVAERCKLPVRIVEQLIKYMAG